MAALSPRLRASALVMKLMGWGFVVGGPLHASLMAIQAFVYPNEHAHLWADVPMLFAISAVMWIWHPNRQIADGARK